MSPEDFINLVNENSDSNANALQTFADRLAFYYQKNWSDWNVVATYINHKDAKLDLIAQIYQYAPAFVEEQPRWTVWKNHPEWHTLINIQGSSLDFGDWPSWTDIPAFYFEYLIKQKNVKLISKIVNTNIYQAIFSRWISKLIVFDHHLIDARLVDNYRGDDHILQEWLPHFARSRHAGVRLAVAKQRCTPADILRKLCIDTDPKVASAAIKHQNFPQDALDILSEHEENRQSQQLDKLDSLTWNELGEFLTHPEFPTEGLDIISARDDEALFFSCVMHPNASESLLQRALASSENWKKAAVALNPRVPESVLRELVQINDFDIAFALASNPSLPEDMQLALANHPDRAIRLHIADQTRSEKVWAAVASHPAPEYLHTPLEAFLALAIDPKAKKDKIDNMYRDINYTRSDGGVMATCIGNALAVHPKIPLPLLGEFLRYMPWLTQHNKTVQLMLLEGKKLPTCASYADFWESEPNLTKSPGYLANDFLQCKNLKLIRMAVTHSGCNKILLFPLWFASDKPLLKRLAQRTDMPRFFYEILWRKSDESIQAVLKNNKALEARGVNFQISESNGQPTHKSAAPTIQKKGIIMINGNKKDRINLAKISDDEKILLALAGDKLRDVRAAVANREILPLSAIELLSLDAEDTIRLKAIEQFQFCSGELTLELETKLYNEGGEIARVLAHYTRQEKLQLQMVTSHPMELASNKNITLNVAEHIFRYGPLESLFELLENTSDKPEFAAKVAKLMHEIYDKRKVSSWPGFEYFQSLFSDASKLEYQDRCAEFFKEKKNNDYIIYYIQHVIERFYYNNKIQELITEFLDSETQFLHLLATAAQFSCDIKDETAKRLLKKSPGLRTALAKNLNLSMSIIDTLKSDPDESVRIALAITHSCVGEYFTKDDSVEVRKQLAENTKDVAVQKLLLLDPVRDVVTQLVINEHCDYLVLKSLLSQKMEIQPKRILVERPETSNEVLELLCNDHIPWIRNQAHRILQERLSAE